MTSLVSGLDCGVCKSKRKITWSKACVARPREESTIDALLNEHVV